MRTANARRKDWFSCECKMWIQFAANLFSIELLLICSKIVLVLFSNPRLLDCCHWRGAGSDTIPHNSCDSCLCLSFCSGNVFSSGVAMHLLCRPILNEVHAAATPPTNQVDSSIVCLVALFCRQNIDNDDEEGDRKNCFALFLYPAGSDDDDDGGVRRHGEKGCDFLTIEPPSQGVRRGTTTTMVGRR